MKKLFTLIELIVVIVVIGILAAIVIPNISSWQQEATHTAVTSNIRNLQTSVDMYMLDNHGGLPVEGVTEFIPKPIDFDKLSPEQIRNLPKTNGFNYWIDAWGTVWGSHVDSPIMEKRSGKILVWRKVEGADKYRIYEVSGYTGTENIITAKIKKTSLEFIEETEKLETLNVEEGNAYVVSSIDKYGFESAPSGVGYLGLPKTKREIKNFTFDGNDFLSNSGIAQLTKAPSTEETQNIGIKFNKIHPDMTIHTIYKNNDGSFDIAAFNGSSQSNEYSYEKYTVSQTSGYEKYVKSTTSVGIGCGYAYYSFNSSTGKFSVSGESKCSYSGTRYSLNGNDLWANAVYSTWGGTRTVYGSRAVSTETKGTLVGTVMGTSSQYPANGKHSDGYWYVKKSAVPKYQLYKYDSEGNELSNYNPENKVLLSGQIDMKEILTQVRVKLEDNTKEFNFYLSEDGTNFVEVEKSKLDGTNLIPLTNPNHILYYKVELIGSTTINGITIYR